jgi:serine/threonine protein kinase
MIKFNRPFGEIDSIYDRQHFNRQLNRDYEYKPQINHKISQTVNHLIYKLLEPNPQKRITPKEVILIVSFNRTYFKTKLIQN